MSKPTLVQTIFNQPSQTYKTAEKREYYSTRAEMMRIAAESVSRTVGTPISLLTFPAPASVGRRRR